MRRTVRWRLRRPRLTLQSAVRAKIIVAKRITRNTQEPGFMFLNRRSLQLFLLVPVLSGLGGYAASKAQQKTSSTAKARRWSDASTWPDKKVPAKDAVVTIGKDMNVVLDVSTPE